MKLINNRYRIESLINRGYNEEGYLIEDLWNKDTREFMRILDNERHSKVISYYIDNFLGLSQIKHKNLLSSDHFGIIESINLKKTNMMLYYVVSEHTEQPTLNNVNGILNLKEILFIILDLISVIDYLHFRDITYKYLSPTQVFYSKDKGAKLLNISSLIEVSQNSFYDSLNEDFIAPEVIMALNNINNKADYYSLGMMMKYLLCKDYLKEKNGTNDFYDELNLTDEGKNVLSNIIDNLTKNAASDRDIKLRTHIDNIISSFNLDYTYNLVEERRTIFLKTKIIGANNELKEILKVDSKIHNNANVFSGVTIKGYTGSGKSRMLNEIIYKLKMKGREIYKIDIIESDSMGLNNISNFLKQITVNASTEYINRYRDDFSSLLPELKSDSPTRDIDLNQVNERYRIFNRISNYLADISKDKVIYFAIDNLEKSNEIFISFIDYLLKNSKVNKVFFILSNNDRSIDNIDIRDRLQHWEDKGLIFSIILNSFSEEESGELVKSILGISYVPKRFASIVHRESRGNPSYIDFIIKDLFNRDELYINNNGNWSTKKDDYSEINFPTDFCDTIKNQLNKFQGDYLRVVKAMSIFNTILSKRTLLSIVDLDANTLDSVLSNLIEERIIEEQEVEWGYNYSIISGELKRFIYSELFESEKLSLHELAAKTIMDLYADKIKLVFDELIYHLIKSNNDDFALNIIVEEAEKIENKYSFNAIILWEKAYSIIKDKDHDYKLKILNILSDIFLLKGDSEKTEIYLNELKRLAVETNNFEYLVKSKYYQADLYLRKNQLEDLNTEILMLEQISRENNIPEGIICASIMKGRMFLNNNNIDLIEDIMIEAIDISYTNNINKYLGSIYTILGYVEYLRGNAEGAINQYTKSINHFEDSENLCEVVKPINNLGVIYSELYGDNKRALSYYEQGLEVATKYGFGQLETTFLNNIGELYLNSLDYNKALDYIKNSKRAAKDINDYRLIFLSYINLGYIDLFTNQLDKAYSSYLFLEKANSLNPILDGEINCQYNNFLGEFYYSFGNMELSLKYSQIASEASKDFNIKEYLRAESRILFIKYLTDGCFDKMLIYSIINKYQESGIVYENLKNILNFSKLCILNGEIEFASELYNEYLKLKGNSKADCLEYTSKFIQLILEDANASDIEKLLIDLGSCESLRVDIDIDLHFYLGMRYIDSNQYSKALRQFMETFDHLYKITKSIPSGELKYNLIKAKKGDLIKKNVNSIYDNVYGKKINTTFLDQGVELDYDKYFDFSPLLELLSKDEFNEIVNVREESYKIKSIEELLLNLNDNYQNNLDFILNYICMETLSQKGFIITLDEQNNSLEVFSSFLENDNNIAIDKVLLQSLRNRGAILINRNSKDANRNKFEEYLSNGLTGIICVPIAIYERYNGEEIDRRKWETPHNTKMTGYIYLETDKVFNRFDIERFKLICSLSNLVFLNIENSNLKLISTTDKLTGTFTRKYFETKFENVFDINKHTNSTFTLLMIDIDNFKLVNDTYGHLKGDEVLTHIGKAIKSSIRSTDIVGRYGGEEFTVILQNTTLEKGKEIGEKIRTNIEAIQILGINRPVTVSIGMSHYPTNSQFKEELLSKADQALYYAKEILNRNKLVLWHEGMDKAYNNVDKVSGIITGNAIIDNRNILAIVDSAELIKEKKSYKDKAYDFLGRILDMVDGEYASLIIIEDNRLMDPITRKRKSTEWIESIKLNNELINKVIDNKKGEYIIDWYNIVTIDKITGNPNWQSVLVIPLIKDDIIKGIVYISVPLKEKEFNSKCFNISNLLCNIFVSNL